jgi:hypothetical protein
VAESAIIIPAIGLESPGPGITGVWLEDVFGIFFTVAGKIVSCGSGLVPPQLQSEIRGGGCNIFWFLNYSMFIEP